MEALFWVSSVVVAYVFVGYPLLLAGLGLVLHRRTIDSSAEPSVSVLVPAYNEAAVIAAKVQSVLEQDYPSDRLELVVASDGSTDGTAQLARDHSADPRVRVLDFPENRGKISVLNDVVPKLRGEIVAFSDAASMLAPDAIRQLVASFADPSVGAVSGVYRVRRKEEALLGTQEDFYWKYETFLKTQEARAGCLLGAHGSLYAIRRELYPFPPPGTINDDYIIPVRILQRGYRVAYEPGAVAFEEAHEMGGFSRRVRIMTGNIQQLREIQPLLRPFRPLAVFFFLSHKAGRVVAPVFMLLALVANLGLLGRPLYDGLAILQVGFYGTAVIGAARPLRPRILRLPYYFCMINAAALLAMARLALPGRRVAWKQGRERQAGASSS
jgi:cellulose synthase/poly-beta-1,6-N-acetylglucosamine synthase-like glycosyltransferase